MNIKSYYQWAMAALLLTVAGCSNDDIQTANSTNTGKETTETAQTSFVTGEESTTRTSLNYDTRDFYWEAGDKIFVKDDANTFQQSSNTVSGTNVLAFKFKMPGTYTQNKYRVYYPGANGTGNNVTIASEQEQNGPDNTLHFGVSGDCGSDEAIRQPNGQYKFKLKHAAAYLCFNPNYDHALTNVYVTKIEVTADKNIAGDYTLNTNGELTGSGNTKTIKLTPKASGSNDGFIMQNNASGTSCETGQMYMVIMPGKYKLTVKYYVKDKDTNVSGAITKTFGEFTYDPNGYYDMPATLSIRSYGDDYYMWDAKQEYWYGHKADQPKIEKVPGTNFPTSSDADRWYNAATFPTAASNKAKDCPNINELFWYCKKGDPHWDNTTLWSVWGHLYTGGIWLKKASVIAQKEGKTTTDLKTASPDDGQNRANKKVWETPPSRTVTQGTPSKLNDYFFLPAMGRYSGGKLTYFRTRGDYWLSTPEPFFPSRGYNLDFDDVKVTVSNSSDRNNGYKLWKAE